MGIFQSDRGVEIYFSSSYHEKKELLQCVFQSRVFMISADFCLVGFPEDVSDKYILQLEHKGRKPKGKNDCMIKEIHVKNFQINTKQMLGITC